MQTNKNECLLAALRQSLDRSEKRLARLLGNNDVFWPVATGLHIAKRADCNARRFSCLIGPISVYRNKFAHMLEQMMRRGHPRTVAVIALQHTYAQILHRIGSQLFVPESLTQRFLQ